MLKLSPVAQESPDMSNEELAELVADIRVHGQLVPIWKSGDEVIDGRKRLMACQKLGIEPKIVDLSPEQRPKDIAYSLNLIRTHYTPSQRAMFAAKRATATKADAGSMRHPATTNLELLGKTVGQAAKETGVSSSTVAVAKRVMRLAAPEVTSAVEAGKLSLHSARKIMENVPVSEQPAMAKKVIEASTAKGKQTPSLIMKRDRRTGRAIRRTRIPDQQAITVLLATVDAFVRLDFSQVSTQEATQIVQAVTRAIRTLIGLRKQLNSGRL